MIRERVLAGLARAREEGTQLGRRRLEDTDARKVAAIRSFRAEGTGLRRISRKLGVGVGTVIRVLGEISTPRKSRAASLAQRRAGVPPCWLGQPVVCIHRIWYMK